MWESQPSNAHLPTAHDNSALHCTLHTTVHTVHIAHHSAHIESTQQRSFVPCTAHSAQCTLLVHYIAHWYLVVYYIAKMHCIVRWLKCSALHDTLKCTEIICIVLHNTLMHAVVFQFIAKNAPPPPFHYNAMSLELQAKAINAATHHKPYCCTIQTLHFTIALSILRTISSPMSSSHCKTSLLTLAPLTLSPNLKTYILQLEDLQGKAGLCCHRKNQLGWRRGSQLRPSPAC